MTEETEPQQQQGSSSTDPAASASASAHSLSQPAAALAHPLEMAESAGSAAPIPEVAAQAPAQYLLVADDVAMRKKRRLGLAYETPLHRAARYGFSV